MSRNDPCPCGSGKRYKHCHGAAPAASQPAGAASSPVPTGIRAAAPPGATPEAQPASASATPHAAPAALARAGVAAHARGDRATAERHYRAALAVNADEPVALHYLGVLRYQQGEPAAALPLLERAVALVPGEPEFHNNHGLALAALQRDADAVAAHERALALKPDHAGAASNLGLARQSCGDVDGAIAAFNAGLATTPDFPQLHWNLALAHLLRGDTREGWREYEWRLRTPELAAALARYPGPAWTGDDPAGRTLLVTAEQGLGDTLQHLRFVSALAQRGARVVVVVPRVLARLSATVPGVAQVVVEGDPLPPFDARVPLMSLPHHLGVTLDDLAANVPYLTADEAQVEAARGALQRDGRTLDVGIAWSGAPGNTNNARRSIPLAALAPLFAIDGVRLVSLKRDGEPLAAGDVAWNERLLRLPMRNNFDGLAALASSVDLVLSVDTSIAHLAGALGRPLWVPLAFVPDWRWLLERTDSPWYPSARLFRQRVPGDWSGPVDEIAQALRECVQRR